jgi:hypothetical protein
MKRVVTVVLRVVIFHVEKYNGKEDSLPTPKIDKDTWTSCDGTTGSQLHHILVIVDCRQLYLMLDC